MNYLGLDRAIVKLTLYYAVLFVVAFVSVDTFVNYSRITVLERDLPNQVDPQLATNLKNTINQDIEDLQTPSYTIYVVSALFIMGIAYLLAGRTFKPIDAIIKAQQRFLVNAAHELRTPLTLIRTEAELSLRGVDILSREELIQALFDISSESIKMTDIINNLLLISSANLDKHSIPFIAVDFSEAAQRGIKNNKELGEERGVLLQKSIAPQILIRGNSVALEQIVTNLLQNALVHTPREGQVTVSLVQTGRVALLKIEDTGVGIRKDELPHIFEPFFKGSIKNDGMKKGTGLGLPIVKELVELHNGSILVSSEPHRGTQVRVTVPVV